jgi:hypothetical protein
MKKYMLVFFLLALMLQARSQSLIGGKNIIKTNLSADALQNYNLIYERSINHFFSISASYANMSYRPLPFKSLAKSLISNSNIDFDNFKIANEAITLEGRFYLGLKKMSGFYIAPYARIGSLGLSVPVNYNYPIQIGNIAMSIPAQAILNGSIQSKSLGAYIGVQYQILTKIVLDFWIIGGHYGTSAGKLQFDAPAFTPQSSLDELKKTIDQTNTNPFRLSTTIVRNNDGTSSVVTKSDGPWAGIRGAGITIGLRF